MKQENEIIEEATTVMGNASQKQMERLIHAVEMLYIVKKDVLTEDEAIKYLGCTPSFFKILCKNREFPYSSLSAYKNCVRRIELEAWMTRPERTIMSSLQIKQEAQEQLAKRKTKIK